MADKRVFDIDADISDKVEIKQRSLTERLEPHGYQFDINFKTLNITKIEEIEKIASMFKFKDSLKEIKVKPKENFDISKLDFSSDLKKVFLNKFIKWVKSQNTKI